MFPSSSFSADSKWETVEYCLSLRRFIDRESSLPFTLKVALEVILKPGFVRGNTILTVLIGVNSRSCTIYDCLPLFFSGFSAITYCHRTYDCFRKEILRWDKIYTPVALQFTVTNNHAFLATYKPTTLD